MQWHSLYDIRSAGNPDELWAWIACAVGTGFLLYASVRRWQGRAVGRAPKLFVFACVLVAGLLPSADHWRLRWQLENDAAQTVEGRVTHYWRREFVTRDPRDSAGKYRRRLYESFTIDGVRFDYWRGASQAGFTHRNRDGTIDLREGVALRVTFVADRDDDPLNRRIVRIESVSGA